MQNEFEKRVQQKLEELDLVPSAPVWTKIEEQIRPKKDRRRLLLWLPLFCILIGGGAWWWLSEGGSPAAAPSARAAASETSSATGTDGTTMSPSAEGPRSADPSMPVGSTPANQATENNRSVSVPGSGSTASVPRTDAVAPTAATDTRQTKGRAKVRIAKNDGPAAARVTTNGSTQSAPAQLRKGMKDPGLSAPQPGRSTSSGEEGDATTTSRKETSAEGSAKQESPAAEGSGAPDVQPVKKTDSVAAEMKPDSAALKTPARKKTAVARWMNRWQLGVTAAVGGSGTGRGIHLFSHQKSLDMTPAASPVVGSGLNAARHPSSSTSSGISFRVGGVMKKAVAPRLNLVTGLQWDYYSTEQTVGKVVDSATRMYNFVSQYSQSAQNTGTYRNSFHFLTLPVEMEWQPMSRLPVVLRGGVALQQMLFTNAIDYNYWGQYYFYEPRTFRKTHLFGRAGIDARFRIGGRTLQAGPEFSYAFSRLHKAHRSEHLYAYSLRVQWMLKK